MRRDGSVIEVKSFVQPSEYVPSIHDYDFSLLELAEPLSLSNAIQPIDLPTDSDILTGGSLCMISGWGNTNYENAFRKTIVLNTTF